MQCVGMVSAGAGATVWVTVVRYQVARREAVRVALFRVSEQIPGHGQRQYVCK